MSISAIILAGAPADPEMQAKYSVKSRAEVPIAGKPMVQHVFDALRASPNVGNICLIGDIQCEGADKIIPSVGSMIDNLIAGVNACEGGHVLISTSDISMLTAEAVDDFIGRCGDLPADLYYAIIPKEACEQRFPGMRRTYVRLAEGTFTGGNMVVISSEFVLKNAEYLRQVFESRKKPLKLARLIGVGTLIRAIIAQKIWAGAINLRVIEKTAGRVLNADLRAVQTPYVEIGSDADDLGQIEYFEAMVNGLAE